VDADAPADPISAALQPRGVDGADEVDDSLTTDVDETRPRSVEQRRGVVALTAFRAPADTDR